MPAIEGVTTTSVDGGLRRSAPSDEPGRLLRRRVGELSGRTRSGLLDALQDVARVPDDGPAVARPAGRIQFLRPPAVRGQLGCVACAAADAESRRWFFFFETETNHDEGVRSRIRAAGGLCAPHTRRLLDSTPAAWLARGMFDDLLRELGAPPGRGRRSAAAWLRHPGRPGRPLTAAGAAARCPVCTAVADRVADTLQVLDRALAQGVAASDVEAAYRAGHGLCVGHSRIFLARAGPRGASVVAAHLVTSLAVPPEEAVAVLVGGDDDAPARARIRATHALAVQEAAAVARRESFAARVEHLTAQPCCPVCAARDRATWRLLDWLGGRGSSGRDHDQPDAHAMREQLAGICALHLSDLVRDDGSGAWLSGPVATVARLSAARWRDAGLGLVEAAERSAPGRSARVGRPDLRRLHDLAVRSGPRMSCLVCAYAAQAAAREFDLVRLVAEDARFGAAVACAHGLCARCIGRVAPGSAWRATFATRTRQLRFEVDEAVRADAWTARWDISGVERSSWQRAPFLLDGAVLGPRAPVG